MKNNIVLFSKEKGPVYGFANGDALDLLVQYSIQSPNFRRVVLQAAAKLTKSDATKRRLEKETEMGDEISLENLG